MSHNIEEFLLSKPHDIFFPAHVPIQDTPPFVPRPEEPAADESTDISTRFDPTTTCPVYEALGYCTFGWKCRFLGAHVQRVGDSSQEGIVADAQAPKVAGWEVVENPGKRAAVVAEGKQGSMNQLTPEESKALQRKRVSPVEGDVNLSLISEQFPYPMSAKYLASIDSSYRYDMAYRPAQPPAVKKSRQETMMVLDEEEEMAAMNAAEQVEDRSGVEAEMDDVPMRPVEKKRLDWRGKTYLAPLTTVGNLVSRPLFSPIIR
jgi:tRNA-dihydrouridine synthase 3